MIAPVEVQLGRTVRARTIEAARGVVLGCGGAYDAAARLGVDARLLLKLWSPRRRVPPRHRLSDRALIELAARLGLRIDQRPPMRRGLRAAILRRLRLEVRALGLERAALMAGIEARQLEWRLRDKKITEPWLDFLRARLLSERRAFRVSPPRHSWPAPGGAA